MAEDLVQVGMARMTLTATSQTFAQLVAAGNVAGMTAVPGKLKSILLNPISGASNWNQNGAASTGTPQVPSLPYQTWIDLIRFNQLQWIGSGSIVDVYFHIREEN